MKKQDKKQDKQVEDLEQRVGELTLDLQRTRADFENYRKRVDGEKSMAKATGRISAVTQLLPIIDVIDRAISHRPDALVGDAWADGVVSISKNLSKMLSELKVKKIDVVPGKTIFDPELHEAISMEDEGGDREIISEELQSGYLMQDLVLRHSMVRVVKK